MVHVTYLQEAAISQLHQAAPAKLPHGLGSRSMAHLHCTSNTLYLRSSCTASLSQLIVRNHNPCTMP